MIIKRNLRLRYNKKLLNFYFAKVSIVNWLTRYIVHQSRDQCSRLKLQSRGVITNKATKAAALVDFETTYIKL